MRAPSACAIVCVLLFLCGAAPVETHAAEQSGLQLVDELLSLFGTDVDSKISGLDQLLFGFNTLFDNGFLLVHRSSRSKRQVPSIKSFAAHAKDFSIIIDEEMVGDEWSHIAGIFPHDEESREAVRHHGLFYLLPFLGSPATGELGTDFLLFFLFIDYFRIIQQGVPIECVLWHEGQRMALLRTTESGVALPRDALYLINDLPCDGSEYVMELRTEIPMWGGGGMVVPFKFLVGLHVADISSVYSPPSLTVVGSIVDPHDDLCPCEENAWWHNGPDPNVPPLDAGESCFDVDYLTDFDLFGMPVPGQPIVITLPWQANELLAGAFPSVFDPAYRCLLKSWFVNNALRNSGYRLIDTGNMEPERPARMDREPLSGAYSESYDGAPLLVAQHVLYLRVGRARRTSGVFGGLDLGNEILAFLRNYSSIRNVRLYVRAPTGCLQRVTLPQLFQTVAWQTWRADRAYSDGRNLLVDHPRVDWGECGPITFMMQALAHVDGHWQPLKAIVAAQAGFYRTNVYGSCILGVEPECFDGAAAEGADTLP